MTNFRGRFGSLTFHKWVQSTIESLIQLLSQLTIRVSGLESYIGTNEDTGKFLFGIPEFSNSFEAIQGGLDYQNVYRNGGSLHTVGHELAVTLIPFKAATEISIASPDIYLIDPYTRGIYAENGLVLSHTGLAGDAKLLTSQTEPITITSSDIEGYINSSTTGAIEISGAPGILGLYIPDASQIDAEACLLLEEINAASATYVNAVNCAALTSVIAPEATQINLSGCALTAQAIEDLLVSLVATGNEQGELNITGGTNETYANWTQGAIDAITELSTILGWAVDYNGQL